MPTLDFSTLFIVSQMVSSAHLYLLALGTIWLLLK